jgi:hypothetical protein
LDHHGQEFEETGAQHLDRFGAPARVIVDFTRVFDPDRARAPDDEGAGREPASVRRNTGR